MVIESKYDNSGRQTIGICTQCSYNKDVGFCHGIDLYCVNEWKKQTATIYLGNKILAYFKDEVLEKDEFLKWCEENGYSDVRCRV